MSDIISTIPFDVQVEILKKMEVKPLMKFRSVSKEFKSLIDSTSFIVGYGVRDPHPYRSIVRYTDNSYYHYNSAYLEKYVFFDDNDDDGIFTQQECVPRVPYVLTKLLHWLRIVGTSHGLLCCYGFNYPSNEMTENNMIILWNPSIRKSIGITLPGELGWYVKGMVFGFGVCPVTSDPIVVKSINLDGWQVEIFTLSSGIWKRVPSTDLPSRESVRLTWYQVVIDRFIYFLAYDMIASMKRDESYDYFHMILSFEMTTKEFTILDLPDNLSYQSHLSLSMSKMRESLVVLEYNWDMAEQGYCVVWMMMEQGVKKSFTKLFTINTDVSLVLGFKKNGDPIISTQGRYDDLATLKVYERCSQHIKQLGIDVEEDSFFMGSYMESLLLLDQPDCFIYQLDHKHVLHY